MDSATAVNTGEIKLPPASAELGQETASAVTDVPDTPAPSADRALKVVDLYKAVIGPRNQAYYLKQFARQEAGTGFRLGWHWPAFVSALNWFVFRKMWGTTAGYLALLLVLCVGFWAAVTSLQLDVMTSAAVALFLWLMVSAGSALLANALYYRHCMSLIHKVLVDGCDRDVAGEMLEAQACNNRRWSGQVLVNVAFLLLLPALATFAPWSWPSLEGQAAETAAAPPAAVPVPEMPNALPVPASPPAATVAPEPPPSPPGPMLPLSEARASAEAGLTMAAEPPSAAAEAVVPAKVVEPAGNPAGQVAAVSPKPDKRLVPKDIAKAPTPDRQTAPAPAPGSAPAPPAGKTLEAPFGVQVGIFAQAANVANVRSQLLALSLPVYVEEIQMGGQPRTRVRVGPFDTEDQAKRTVKAISDVGLPAVLIRLPKSSAARQGAVGASSP